MLPLFIITTILLTIALVFMIVKCDRAKDSSDFWFEKWRQAEEDVITAQKCYSALDEGTDEIEENYQQDILDLHDKLVSVTNSSNYWLDIASKLEEIRLNHDYQCLPVLGTDIYPTAEDDDTPIYNSVVG